MSNLMLAADCGTFEFKSESGGAVAAIIDSTADPETMRITIEVEDWDGEVINIWEYYSSRRDVEGGVWDLFLQGIIERLNEGCLDFTW